MPIKKKILEIRIKPYPPNFNKTAARIIEPATGASTWAFGNHKCTINIGIFTTKAKTLQKYQILIIKPEVLNTAVKPNTRVPDLL